MSETASSSDNLPESLFDAMPGTHSAVVETVRRNKNLIMTGISLAGYGNVAAEFTGIEDIATGSLIAGAGCLALAHLKYRSSNGRVLSERLADLENDQRRWSQPIDWQKDRVRWYGFDAGYHKQGFDPLANIGELHGLAADLSNTPTRIAVSSKILEHASEEARYGYVSTGSRFLSHKVIDLKADPHIIVMKPKACQKLVHDLVHRQTQTSMDRAIDQLAEVVPGHPAIKVYAAHGLEAAPLIEKILRPRIEERATDTTVHLERGSDGLDFQRRRSHSRGVINGQHLQLYSETQLYDGTATIRHDGARHITSQRSFNEVLEHAHQKHDAGEKPIDELESAIWLLLNQYKHQQQIPHGNARPVAGSVRQRIQEERPRLYPYLRSYAAGRDKETASLRFASPARTLAIGGLAVVLMIGGAHAAIDHFLQESHSSDTEHKHDTQAFSGTIGDVTDANHPEIIWDIKAHNGASTAGYWANQVDNTLSISTDTLNYSTPPLDNGFVAFDRIEQGSSNAHRTLTGFPLGGQPLQPGQPYVSVTGHTSAYNLTDFRTGLPDGAENNVVEYAEGYQLPVPSGKLVSGVTVTVDGVRLAANQVALFEDQDYTFSVRIKNKDVFGGHTEGDVELTYSIAESHMPILIPSARSNITLNGNPDTLLAQVITGNDRTKLGEQLRVKPTDLSPTALSEAVEHSHTYSFTPYKDSHAKSNHTSHDVHDILMSVASQAIKQPAANCNVATLQTILLSSGRDTLRHEPLNPVEGFHVDENASAIKSTDAHMWIVDDKGDIFDPTPAASVAAQPRPDSKPDWEQKGMEAGLVLGGLGYLGYRARQRRARHKEQTVVATLYPTDPETIQARHKQASILEWLRYAPTDSTYNEQAILKRTENNAHRPLSERYRALPQFTRKHLKHLLKERGAAIPSDQGKELFVLARALQYQK